VLTPTTYRFERVRDVLGCSSGAQEVTLNPLYVLLGSETALADRALAKLTSQLKDEKCEITTLFASDCLVGDIADALAPSLFSERRALIIKDLQEFTRR
jgi:DNA polymerase-3 subunit delta